MTERSKRLYRDTEQQKIAGVCSGIARYVDVDPLIVRVVFVVLVPLSGFGLVFYLAGWLVMSPAPEGYWAEADAERPGRRIYKDPDDKKLAGVCGGIAKAYGVDPTIIRLAAVALVFLGGAGILAYLVLAVLLDPPPAGTDGDATDLHDDGDGDEPHDEAGGAEDGDRG